MALSIQEDVFTLLAEVDAVAAEEEHRSTILSAGEPSLGLGLVALALSEQWRPKRTERLRLHRDDAIETEFLCELDLDVATRLTRTTSGPEGIWLPLHRLRRGLMPPTSAVDETDAQLPVMSRGEVAAHVGAGVAQILGSSVFREAFSTRPRPAGASANPQRLRRRTPASVILSEAVTRILIRRWSAEGQAPQPIISQNLSGCGSCSEFSERSSLTLREFGLARYLLHRAAHTWLADTKARQISTLSDLHQLDYLVKAEPSHDDPHFVVDAGLNALDVVGRGPIVVAQTHQLTGRTTITTVLPPRRSEHPVPRGERHGDVPNQEGARVGTSQRRGLPLLLDPLVVPYEIELSGLRLNQSLGLDARVESGVELISVPTGEDTNRCDGSHISVLLQGSAPLTSPPILTPDEPHSNVDDDASSSTPHSPPHPIPEFCMAVDNLERAWDAHPDEVASAPLPLGTFAALNRCGAHASQVARLLYATERPADGDAEQRLIDDFRTFAQSCQNMIEDSGTADYERLSNVCEAGRDLATRCSNLPSQEQLFFDADFQPGVFRCQIGRKDIPDRFIRPVHATANLRAQLEPGLANTLRRQVINQFFITSGLLVVMLFLVWLVRPDAEPVITILLAVPAVSVFLQRISSVATLRSQLEAPYRRWQYISLGAPVLAAIAALPLRQCDRPTTFGELVAACPGQISPWWLVAPPVISVVLMGIASQRLTFGRHTAPVFAATSFEPGHPSYDELRQIGQTAADSAARASQGGPWYVVARSAEGICNPTGLTTASDAAAPNLMGLPEVVPTSEFWVRLGSRNYEFTSVRAETGTATTELLRPVFSLAWPDDPAPIVRSFSSVADAPVFGAGQLSEAWLAWNAPGRSDPGPFIRDVALLGAAYEGPLSYFHLRSWENGHLFSRVGTLLSQRGHRDEVAFEGAVSTIARRHHPGPTGHWGRDYLSFLPPTFLQQDEPPEPDTEADAAPTGSSYWDIVLLATAQTDTAHKVLNLFDCHPKVAVLDGSMTIVRGIEAIVLALGLEPSDCGCANDAHRSCDCVKEDLDLELRCHLELESDLADAPRLLWRRVDDDYCDGDRFRQEQGRRTLWIGWSGSADHADCNWLLVQIRSWFDTMAGHPQRDLRIGDLELDYLVCRQRREATQVGRARISFDSLADNDSDSFGVWEATLTKTLQHARSRGEDESGRGVPAGLVVDVQRFEPRSQRYSGSKLGGQVQ